MTSLVVGEVSLSSVADGTSFLPADHFGVTDGPAHAQALGADGRLHIPIGGFVLRTAEAIVLLDTGLGPRTIEWEPSPGRTVGLEGGALPRSLAALGLTPADIDIVLLSHLHGDHSGWVWQQGKPFFPHATVRFGRGDWDAFVEQGAPGVDGSVIRALADSGRVELIDSDGPVAPNVNALHTPGHTPGHHSYIVASGDERAFFLGDILSCPLQMQRPELEASADMDPALGIQVRERILRELEVGDLVSGPHFPELRWGRIMLGRGQKFWN